MPGEMLVPIILTRVIEPHGCAADWIERLRFVVLSVVASLTSQCEIVSSGRATEGFGNNVFVGMILRGMRFRADAVFTTALCARFDLVLQLGRDVTFSHAARA
jgi:hypothetical protein